MGRRSPKRNMTLTRTASAYAYQAADTRHTKLTSQAGTTRATRFYGARHGQIFQTPTLNAPGSPERIDHRSNAERGIDEIPTVHMGVAACQMEKKGIATEKGELNRNIQKANRLIREIGRRLGSSKSGLPTCSKRGKPPQNSRRNLPTLQIC